MKKIKKIGWLVAIFLVIPYNTCFADVVMTEEQGRHHGIQHFPVEPETNPINCILIGILVLVIVICAVIIIRTIIKKKKENDNK